MSCTNPLFSSLNLLTNVDCTRMSHSYGNWVLFSWLNTGTLAVCVSNQLTTANATDLRCRGNFRYYWPKAPCDKWLTTNLLRLRITFSNNYIQYNPSTEVRNFRVSDRLTKNNLADWRMILSPRRRQFLRGSDKIVYQIARRVLVIAIYAKVTHLRTRSVYIHSS